jgi:hypothetical protein
MRRVKRQGLAVRRWIQKNGATVRTVYDQKIYGVHPLINAPFSYHLGCDWAAKTIFWRHGKFSDLETVVGAIHEAGHVLASHLDPNDPRATGEDEAEWLGWEMLVALECGISLAEFAKANSAYVLGDLDISGVEVTSFLEIGDVPTEKLPELLEKVVEISIDKGYVSISRQPLICR